MRHWIKSLWIACVFLLLYLFFSLFTAQAQSPTPATATPPARRVAPPGRSLPAQNALSPSVSSGVRAARATNACAGTYRSSLPGNAVVVDDLDSRFTRYGPYWYEVSGSSSDYYNGHMYLTTN